VEPRGAARCHSTPAGGPGSKKPDIFRSFCGDPDAIAAHKEPERSSIEMGSARFAKLNVSLLPLSIA